MDVALVIRRRLRQSGLEPRDLAAAAQGTELYMSQLLIRKKSPPATDHTGIYEITDQFLKLSSGELAMLAGEQRLEELQKKLSVPPFPLLKEGRGSVLRGYNAEPGP